MQAILKKEELKRRCGSDKYRIVKVAKISSLPGKQLLSMLNERNIPLKYPVSHQHLVDALRTDLNGSNQVVMIDRIKIDLLTRHQLELALSNISRPKKKTILEMQQEFAENSGYASEVIWDLLSKYDGHIMKNKIEQLIPNQESNQQVVNQMRQDIFRNIWAQRKYTNGNSLTSIFYVLVAKETDFNIALESTKFSCHPVFRCRKCFDSHDSSKYCMIYVDEIGRVYRNWNSFLNDNVLPAGTMVSPRRGVYNFDSMNNVILEVYRTPNAMPGAIALDAAQRGSAVLSVGAACVPIASSLMVPVAAPVMAAASLVGLGIGAFSAVTSVMHLSDRQKHQQSISIGDSQARSSYLGIAGGVFGIASVGTTRAMTSLATAGKTTAGLEMLINGINISTIVLSGSGVVNGVLDLMLKYVDDDQITSLDVLHLSASLILFTHSVRNFQLASKIATEARTKSIKSYRKTLGKLQRKIFENMFKENTYMRGDTLGKWDIIRSINKIPDRSFLDSLFKFKNTGVAKLAHGSYMLFSKNEGDHSDTHSKISLQQTFDDHANVQLREGKMKILKSLAILLPDGAIIELKQFGELFLRKICDGEKFQDVIESMAKNLPEKILRYILNLTRRFMEEKMFQILAYFKVNIQTEIVIFRILKNILRNYMNYESVLKAGNEILEQIENYYRSLNVHNQKNITRKCPDCNGYYTLCCL